MKHSILSLLVLMLLANAKPTLAQSNFTGYFMPTVGIEYDLSKKFSQTVEVESRNFVYSDDDFGLQAKHLEFSYLTEFEHKANHTMGLAIKYRFQSLKDEEDELRLVQQYKWKKQDNSIIEHRLRVEERIYSSLTAFRFRYKTGFNFEPKSFCDAVSIGNELVLETSRKNKPEYEERLSAELAWNISPKSEFAIGSQYRLSNFTRSSEHNLFLTVGLSFEL